jgi:hypothetical protein
MGAKPPCKPRPCSQEAACSRLMAVTQRRSPRALQTYPTTSASGRGVRRQAPQRRTTTGDRITEARASTGLTHPMHQAHRRGRAPGRVDVPGAWDA